MSSDDGGATPPADGGVSQPTPDAGQPLAFGAAEWLKHGDENAFTSVVGNAAHVWTASKVDASGTTSTLLELDDNGNDVRSQSTGDFFAQSLSLAPNQTEIVAVGNPDTSAPAPHATYHVASAGGDWSKLTSADAAGCDYRSAAVSGGQVATVSNCLGDAGGSVAYGPTQPWHLAGDRYFVLLDVGADAAGNVLVLAHAVGTAVFDGTTYGVPGVSAGIILKFSPQGALIWAHQIAPTTANGSVDPWRLAVNGDGSSYVGVNFTGGMKFGSKTFDAANGHGALLVLGATGSELRAAQVDLDGVEAVSATEAGGAFVVGFRDACEYGFTVAKVTPQSTVTAKDFACNTRSTVNQTAAAGDDLVLSVSYQGTVDFGGGLNTGTDYLGTLLVRIAGGS